MAFSLGYQDKLALMMTLYGSQRALGQAMGVSHQRIGRWLREGEPKLIEPETGETLKQAGAKQIPLEARESINALFSIHKDIVKSQAKADGLFYDSRIPVFLNRPILRNGQKGGRVYAEHTHYMRDELRANYLGLAHAYKQFIAASVRSKINIYSYVGAASTDKKQKRAKRYRKADFGIPAEAIIQAGGSSMPVFTKYENFSAGTSARLAVNNLFAKLDKHSPHAEEFANSFLFQLATQRLENEKTAKAIKRTNRARRKR